jgi:predicted DNA-binding transcriptional regulator YafY
MGRAQKHLRRLILFVDALKRGEAPNAVSFADKLAAMDVQRNEDLAVCSKTVKRDIAYLREVLGAPLEYDAEQRGYILLDRSWTFPFLQLEDDELFAAMFSEHLGQELLPTPFQDRLEAAMDVQLAAGEPGRLTPDLLNSLIIATGTVPPVRPEVFETVIAAWRQARSLHVQYQRPGSLVPVHRDIDIHALFLCDGAWYARVYCHLRQAYRSLALHRMDQPALLDSRFERSPAIVSEIRAGRVFAYPMVRDVQLRCSRDKAPIIREREWFAGQVLHELEDGRLDIQLKEAPRPTLIWWVLSFAGHLEVKAPRSLRENVRRAGELLARTHQSADSAAIPEDTGDIDIIPTAVTELEEREY